MAAYVAFLAITDPEGNQRVRPAHLEYIRKLHDEGKAMHAGPFTDGKGGMVIYQAESYEEALQLAQGDPVIQEGVRTLELREWTMLF